MKFFTLKWYRNDKHEADYSKVFGSYRKHLEALTEILPASVIELAKT